MGRLAVAPNGKLIAFSSEISIHIWDLDRGGPPLKIEKAHDREITALTFSRDSKTVISGGFRRKLIVGEERYSESFAQIRAWDAATGRRTSELPEELTKQHVTDLWVSPDGATLFASLLDQVRVLAWPSWKTLSALQTPGIRSFGHPAMGVSRDGKTLALASARCAIQIWDVPASKQRLVVEESHVDRVPAVDFGPDGRIAATGSWDGTVRLWDARTGAQLRRLVYSDRPMNLTAVRFSPDGRTLAAVGNHREKVVSVVGAVKVWKVATGELLRDFRFPGLSMSIAFSADGKQLAVGSMNTLGAVGEEPGGLIRIYDVEAGKEAGQLEGHGQTVLAMSYTPQGERLVSVAQDWSIRVWNVATFKEDRNVRIDEVPSAALSGDGSLAILSSRKEMSRWNVASGAKAKDFDLGADTRFGPRRLALSPDKRLLVTDGKSASRGASLFTASVRLWSVAEGRELLSIACPDGMAAAFAFSPDGRKLASGLGDGTALIWDVSPAYDKLSKPAEKKP